jgi:hypothetical protein
MAKINKYKDKKLLAKSWPVPYNAIQCSIYPNMQ